MTFEDHIAKALETAPNTDVQRALRAVLAGVQHERLTSQDAPADANQSGSE